MGKLLSELRFDDATREELNQEDLLSYALLQILSVYKEEFRSLKGLMIVFDSTNTTGSLIISEGKYVLLNPELLRGTLKGSVSLAEIQATNSGIVLELQDLYRDYGK